MARSDARYTNLVSVAIRPHKSQGPDTEPGDLIWYHNGTESSTEVWGYADMLRVHKLNISSQVDYIVEQSCCAFMKNPTDDTFISTYIYVYALLIFSLILWHLDYFDPHVFTLTTMAIHHKCHRSFQPLHNNSYLNGIVAHWTRRDSGYDGRLVI